MHTYVARGTWAHLCTQCALLAVFHTQRIRGLSLLQMLALDLFTAIQGQAKKGRVTSSDQRIPRNMLQFLFFVKRPSI